MGVDLRLLPMRYDTLALSMLEMDRDNDLFDIIAETELKDGIVVDDKGIQSNSATLKNGDTGYGTTIKTPYGNKMKSLTAGQLSKCFASYKADISRENKAVIAYIKAYPKDKKVYLFWH